MLLSVLLVIFLFAIAFFQASQGWFSALIMVVLTICSATAALGSYEWVAINWLAPFWKPDYSYAIALAAVFGIPLVILRAITDKLVRRSCLLPVMLDRIGGGICGFITAFIMVGILAHTLQMIPFDGSILGYARVHRISKGETPATAPADEKQQQERDLWLKPDRFAVGVASLLSVGVFSGEQALGGASPDIVQAVGWANAVPAEVSRFAPPGSISVKEAVTVPFVYKYARANQRAGTEESYDAKSPKAQHHFLMLAINLTNKARDHRRSFVFSLRQFRLVGRREGKGPYEQYHAIAIRQADASQQVNRHVRTVVRNRRPQLIVDEPLSPQDVGKGEVEVVFEVPESFAPEYVEYKRGAIATVPRSGDESAGRAKRRQPPAEQQPDAAVAEATPPVPDNVDRPDRSGRKRRGRRSRSSDDQTGGNRGGNVRGVTTRAGLSIFGEALPVSMESYRQLKNVEISSNKLVSGHLVGEFDKQDEGTDREISRFDVPRNKRLLQLNTTQLHTQSLIGDALDFAASTVQNYFVEDSNGNSYKLVGKCAIADVNGTRYVEAQYFRDPTGSIGGVGKFDKIKKSDLKGDYELILLFLVDPGVEIVSFRTGGSASRADDLRGENLIAPE